MEKILAFLHSELTYPKAPEESTWKKRLETKLYKYGESVIFAEGASDSQKFTHGRLEGIGEGGELIIIPEGKTKPMHFMNGELRVY